MPWMIRNFIQLPDLQPKALSVGVPDDLEEGDGHLTIATVKWNKTYLFRKYFCRLREAPLPRGGG